MGKVVFIGDDHGKDGSIKSNYQRFKSINGKIGNNYVVLLEINYDGKPEESGSIDGILDDVTTHKKGGSLDKDFLRKKSNLENVSVSIPTVEKPHQIDITSNTRTF